MKFKSSFHSSFLIASLVGCSTPSEKYDLDYFRSTESIELGSAESRVLERLGKPSQIERETVGSRMTYSINYKGMEIPKVIIWLDSDNKVSRKHINLFQETKDNMKVSDAKKRLGANQLVIRSTPELEHSVSARKMMDDNSVGISVLVNEADGGEVLSVGWFEPSPKEAKVTGR